MKKFLTLLGLLLIISNYSYALNAPNLTVSTSGLKVTLSWTPINEATGYILYYAPYPYTGSDSIGKIDMGNKTSLSVTLWDGASYYVAVTARNNEGESTYSNIGSFSLKEEKPNIVGKWNVTILSEVITKNPYGYCYVTDVGDTYTLEVTALTDNAVTVSSIELGYSANATKNSNDIYSMSFEVYDDDGWSIGNMDFWLVSDNQIKGTIKYNFEDGICEGEETFIGKRQ